MVVDIAKFLVATSPVNTTTYTVDVMPPMYPHLAHAALKHIRSSAQRENVAWLESAEDVIQTSLSEYFRRWGVCDDYTRP
jgi:hypothetical protein